MSPRRRTGRRLLKTLFPILLLVLLAVTAAVGWVVYSVVHPPRRPYLVTPEKFSQLSDRGLKVTDETWPNRDQTQARGWLLRGAEGAPAVILLHRYGADRSWLLNLGVKLNETTNYTVLWPDLRGHGLNPPTPWTSFGTREAEDVAAALDHLRSLKTAQGRPLVGDSVGLYGVELGAYAALQAAARDKGVRALVLDSVPAAPDDLLRATVRERINMDNPLLQTLTRWGARIYFLGHYENASACAAAHSLGMRRVLLLTGEEAGYLRDSTTALAQCFPDQAGVEIKSDLPLTGFNLPSATGEQGEAYDRRVIDFFDRSLRATP
jgi:pimeloyl-ACP methyl ester carboxylesterase